MTKKYTSFIETLAQGAEMKPVPFDSLLDYRPFTISGVHNYNKYVVGIATAHSHSKVSKNKLFIAYPKKYEHAQLFAQSDTQTGGPNYFFPGSIAILKGFSQDDQLDLHYLQYSFKQGSPKELSRSIVSTYLGARKRLLEQALHEMVQENLHTLALSKTLNKKRSNRETIDDLLQRDEYSHIHKITK